jgi:hypothetical protein
MEESRVLGRSLESSLLSQESLQVQMGCGQYCVYYIEAASMVCASIAMEFGSLDMVKKH